MSVAEKKLTYSVQEAAEAIGISEALLRRRVKSGALKARKEGDRILILPIDLHKYLTDLPLVSNRETTDGA